MMEISDERFEELVDQALAQIPDEVHEHIKKRGVSDRGL